MDELEFHKLMLEYLYASDEKPKNIELKCEDYERLWDEAFKNTSMTMDDLRNNAQLTIATDDNGDEVILPYLVIPKTD